jgi:hypothetical protein
VKEYSNVLRVIALLSFLILTGCHHKKSISHEGNSPLHIDETKLKPGDVIKPFEYLNAGEHDWKVEIRISGDDLLDLSKRKMSSRKFWTSDELLLERIKNWQFVFGKKGKYKPTSTFRIYRDNQLIDKHGLVIEKHFMMGYQSTKYGLLEPKDQDDMFDLINEMNTY